MMSEGSKCFGTHARKTIKALLGSGWCSFKSKFFDRKIRGWQNEGKILGHLKKSLSPLNKNFSGQNRGNFAVQALYDGYYRFASVFCRVIFFPAQTIPKMNSRG